MLFKRFHDPLHRVPAPALPCPKLVPGQERLTPEQEAYARQFAQERIAALLSTTASDEQLAEDLLAEAYRRAGHHPVPVRWFDPPRAFCLAYSARIGESVRESVVKSVRESVLTRIEARVRESVGKSVWAIVRESVSAYYDEAWHSFYRFFHEVFKKNELIYLALFNEMVSG